jgi:hypothetical protein
LPPAPISSLESRADFIASATAPQTPVYVSFSPV